MHFEFRDPLPGFDWSNLEIAYQERAYRYDDKSPHLTCLGESAPSEQALYRILVRRFANERGRGIDICTYRAMLYWKLYSQPASLVTNCEPLQTEPLLTATQAALRKLSSALNEQPPRNQDADNVLALIGLFDRFRIHGTKDRSALAVRATVLHFCFPEVVPLYDKQVLLATTNLSKETVKKVARQKDTLRQYIPFAWNLAKEYGDRLPAGWPETPLRLIDMALWVHRGTSSPTCSFQSGE